MDTIIAFIFLGLFLMMAAAYYRYCRNAAGGVMHFVSTVLSFDAQKKGGDEDSERASIINDTASRPRPDKADDIRTASRKKGGHKR